MMPIIPGSMTEVTPQQSTADDPWAHRSERMKCMTCMWFAMKASKGMVSDEKGVGRCRRHAPTLSGYPVVFVSDWCGDHKLNEEVV